MDRQETVQKLATAGRLSIAHAEDLYDSLFPRPVVPQFVADWYEGNKRNLDLNLCSFVFDLAMNSTDCYREEFKAWAEDNKKTLITTIVNMHQIGYEVEKEPRYIVKIKATRQCLSNEDNWPHFNLNFKTHFTKSELERLGFEWVFDCPGIEVKEVDDGND
nr:MAG TPA: Protein of unknown function (DUF1642) [Caudoviricetes sp.]